MRITGYRKPVDKVAGGALVSKLRRTYASRSEWPTHINAFRLDIVDKMGKKLAVSGEAVVLIEERILFTEFPQIIPSLCGGGFNEFALEPGMDTEKPTWDKIRTVYAVYPFGRTPFELPRGFIDECGGDSDAVELELQADIERTFYPSEWDIFIVEERSAGTNWGNLDYMIRGPMNNVYKKFTGKERKSDACSNLLCEIAMIRLEKSELLIHHRWLDMLPA